VPSVRKPIALQKVSPAKIMKRELILRWVILTKSKVLVQISDFVGINGIVEIM
jgi:hypothetical protein